MNLTASKPSHTCRRLLIVEDERIVAEDLALALEDLGHEVVGIAARGDKAIELADKHRPELVCMDIVIRGEQDGIETALLLRKEFNIPSMFMSAYSDDETVERAKLTEPAGYLVKPYDSTVLRCTLEVAFSKIDSDRRLEEQSKWLEEEAQRRADDLKHTQRQLIEAQKMEAIGTLSGGIAHDFNNMLLPIIGYSDMLRTALDDKPELKQHADEVYRAATSASSLTKQLLAFSRRQVLEKQDSDIHEVIRGSKKMLRRLIGENISLRLDLSAGPVYSIIDSGQIEQVLMNLCINARDSMEGRGDINIRTRLIEKGDSGAPDIAADVEHDWVRVEIQDTGSGMSQDVLEQIFDPFYSTKGNKGTGLGLSVVHGIVSQHDGQILVSSKVGEGTRFEIYLPVSSDQEHSQENRSAGRISETVPGNGERILVIEDEPQVRLFVSRALSNHGYRVDTAYDLCSAKALLNNSNGLPEQERYDLIFSDCVLPDGNGVDFLVELYQEEPDLNAILTTGYTDREALVDAASSYDIAFLQKPYPLPKLFAMVSEVLERSKLAMAS